MDKHIDFQERAWKEYLSWQREDMKGLRKLNDLIRDIMREPYDGIGKPEPLRGALSGWWSRRIDDKNRIVYRAKGDRVIEIAQCKGHYGDK